MKRRRLTTKGLIDYLNALGEYMPPNSGYILPLYRPCEKGMNALALVIEKFPSITPKGIWELADDSTWRSLDIGWFLDTVPETQNRNGPPVAVRAKRLASERGLPIFLNTADSYRRHISFDDAEAQVIDEAVNTLGLKLEDITEEVEEDELCGRGGDVRQADGVLLPVRL